MATLPPQHMVPTIPSGALPQTPVDEWANSTNDVLGAHVTRTPLGTPGPDVPGAFPDAQFEQPTTNQNQEGSLLESAKAYLPAQADVTRALSNAKAYLPEGVAAYFPTSSSTDSTSSLPPLPPSTSTLSRQDTESSTAVDIGHGASVPYTPAGPAPYARQDTESSTAVDIGHGASVPYTPAGPAPYATDADSSLATPPREDTDHSMAVHTGHSAPSLATPTREQTDLSTAVHTGHSSTSVAPASLSTPAREDADLSTAVHTGHSSLSLPHDTSASKSDFTAETPMFVQSPPALSTESSTDLALAAPHHPAALVPGSGSAPSLVPSNDSGYTASSESAFVATPSPLPMPQGGAALNSSRYEDNFPTAPPVPAKEKEVTAGAFQDTERFSSVSQSEGPRAPEKATSTFVADATPSTHGSAALNSSRYEDNVPTGTEPEAHSGGAGYGGRKEGEFGVLGSAALNSSDPRDLVPSGDAHSGEDSDVDADGEVDETATEGTGAKKGKKPKLLQRLKEKMHVGGS